MQPSDRRPNCSGKPFVNSKIDHLRGDGPRELDDKSCLFRLRLGQRTGIGVDLGGTAFRNAGGLVGGSH